MDAIFLPYNAPIEKFEQQAEQLLAALHAGNQHAICLFNQKHPRFLDKDVPWLPLSLENGAIEAAGLNIDDARLTVARGYDFEDWDAIGEYLAAIADPASPTARFEAAVQTVVTGDAATLRRLLTESPDLVHARSIRRNAFDPPVHRATLLHYVAANGVEGFRQKTPPNAVEMARILLEAGADPNSLASLYGGEWETLSLLVSSCHPANAGLHAPLIDVLADFGASVIGTRKGPSPLATALAFSYLPAAEALVRLGAPIEDLSEAAGLGRIAEARQLLPSASPESRHRAMSLSAQLGHVEVLRLLLEAGEDPNRFNLKSNHAHSTPLHQAALAGHLETVKLLIAHGARLDTKDKIYQSTPLGWAEHAHQTGIVQLLSKRSTSDDS